MTKAEVDETYFAVEDGKWTYRVYGNGMAGIAETAKANNLKFYDYFEYLLTEISKHTEDQNTDFLAEFLP